MLLQLLFFLGLPALLHHGKLSLLVFSLNQQLVLLLLLGLGVVRPHFSLLPVVAAECLLLLEHLLGLREVYCHVRDRLRVGGRDTAVLALSGLDRLVRQID